MKWKYWKSYAKGIWHFYERATARRNNWYYEIWRPAYSSKKFSVSIENKKLDIRYISAWSENNKYFITLEEAKEFCESFNYKKHYCLGNGVKNETRT